MTGDPWTHLGALLKERREELERPQRANRARFAREHGVSDRLLHDLEAGKRENYDAATLGQVEDIYEWERGSIAAVLAGGEPTLPDRSDVTFYGPGPTDALIFQRPPGISDDTWAAQRARMAADYAEWLTQAGSDVRKR